MRDLMQGRFAAEMLPQARVFFWVDVRDLAEAHVRSVHVPEAGGKRFFVTAGDYSNEEIARAVGDAFQEYEAKLPTDFNLARYGEGRPTFDNKPSVEILGIKYRTIQECVVDTVKSLKDVPE